MIHVATTVLVTVTPAGVVKPKTEMTIGERAIANQEIRVMPDPDIPNTANYPTIKAYLALEDAAGLNLVHMDQTYIITQD